MRYHAPCDPECPVYREYADTLINDQITIAMGAPVDEFMEAYEQRHRALCERCANYGLANIEVVDD